MRTLLLIICTLVLGLPHGLAETEITPDRQKRLEKGQIIAFLKKQKGDQPREGVALGIINASMQDIFKTITDYDHYKDFMPRTTVSEVREKEKHRVVFFTKVDMVWPADDLEYLCEVTWDESENHLAFAMVPGSAKGVKTFSGSWDLSPVNGSTSKTFAEYHLQFVPERWYPGWVVRLALNKSLKPIIEAIRERIKEANSNQNVSSDNKA